ncbi:hypothetical protein ACFL1H_04375 [Nanoarchaeota archaeon]
MKYVMGLLLGSACILSGCTQNSNVENQVQIEENSSEYINNCKNPIQFKNDEIKKNILISNLSIDIFSFDSSCEDMKISSLNYIYNDHIKVKNLINENNYQDNCSDRIKEIDENILKMNVCIHRNLSILPLSYDHIESTNCNENDIENLIEVIVDNQEINEIDKSLYFNELINDFIQKNPNYKERSDKARDKAFSCLKDKFSLNEIETNYYSSILDIIENEMMHNITNLEKLNSVYEARDYLLGSINTKILTVDEIKGLNHKNNETYNKISAYIDENKIQGLEDFLIKFNKDMESLNTYVSDLTSK